MARHPSSLLGRPIDHDTPIRRAPLRARRLVPVAPNMARLQPFLCPEKRAVIEGIRRPTPAQGHAGGGGRDTGAFVATPPRDARGIASGSSPLVPAGLGHPASSSASPLLASPGGALKRPSSGALPVRLGRPLGVREGKPLVVFLLSDATICFQLERGWVKWPRETASLLLQLASKSYSRAAHKEVVDRDLVQRNTGFSTTGCLFVGGGGTLWANCYDKRILFTIASPTALFGGGGGESINSRF